MQEIIFLRTLSLGNDSHFALVALTHTLGGHAGMVTQGYMDDAALVGWHGFQGH